MALGAKLDRWRTDLIDMSRNNGLLYYKAAGKETRGRFAGVRLEVDDVAGLYQSLTREPAAKAIPKPTPGAAARGDGMSLTSLGVNLADEANADLARRIERLRIKARDDLKERGLLTLYLVFGLLAWRESEASAEVIHSPLLLAPVTLTRVGARGELTLKRAAEQEIEINPTLRERLASSFRLQLPTYAELVAQLAPADAPSASGARSRATMGPPSLEVALGALRRVFDQFPPQLPWETTTEVHLGRFFFQKLVMRKDLQEHEPEALAHPMLRRLGGDIQRMPEPASAPANRLDELLAPGQMLEALDADSSQQEAIEAAKAGASFVLQGPPGTGKSQTIANIIAEVLGQGRSVLFVSEKMAALEVVRKRLQEVGLADFCLTLHDPRADKKVFIEELRTALRDADATPNPNDEARWRRAADELTREREHLNRYERELHAPRFALGIKAFEAYGQLARLAAAPASDFALPKVEQITDAQFNAMGEALRDLLDYRDVLDVYTTHPWRETLATTYTAALESSAADHLTSLAQALADAQPPLVAIRQGLGEAGAVVAASDGASGDHAGAADGAAGGESATPITFAYARDAIARMGEALTTPLPPRHWLRASATQQLRPVLMGAVSSAANYQQQRHRIDPLYAPTVRALDHAALLRALRDESAPAVNRLRPPAASAPPPDAHQVALTWRSDLDGTLTDAAQMLRELIVASAAVADVCGLRAPTTLAATAALLGLARLLLATPMPPKSWLEADTYAEARIVAQDADERYNACAQARGDLQTRYTASYFSLDLLRPIAQRFREQYQSVVRYVRPRYYQDVARLRALASGGPAPSPLAPTALEADLNQALKLLDSEAWLAEHRSEHARALGRVFAGASTNWSQARALVAWADEFQTVYGEYCAYDDEVEAGAPGAGVVRLATGPATLRDALHRQTERLASRWERWRQGQASLERLLRLDALPGVPYSVGAAEPTTLVGALERQRADLRLFWAAADVVNGQRLAQPPRQEADATNGSPMALAATATADAISAPRAWADLCGDLLAAQGVQAFETWLAENNAALRESLGAAFQGTATDWAGQLAALEWVERLLRHYPSGEPPAALVEVVAQDGDEALRESMRAAVAEAHVRLLVADADLRWLDTLLPRRALLPTGATRAATDAPQDATLLAAMCERVVAQHDALPHLRRWLECGALIQRCRGLGLGDLLDRALQQRPFPSAIVAQFEQRFYRLWIDQVWQISEPLRSFSGDAHERIVARFQANDQGYAKLARARLRGRLLAKRATTRQRAQPISQAPSRASAGYAPRPTATPADQRLIQAYTRLQQEVTRKRHDSIRLIVRNVAPALLELKPCWMMSPLTVSQYVESGERLFDLVIFDEASQVSPEDAICAILRGNQLIVVGDTKQLPPTRFFSKTMADVEDEDDDDDGASGLAEADTAHRESILLECLSGDLPERSLKWHYRSRHESLIAFSNHEFYHDDLITFPSPEAESADGVRFVYVANAVYDRSHTRTNKQEAERVVDLLLEAVQRTPDRSLGVVALSSAQENAIRDALETRFKRQPELRTWRDQLNEDSNAPDSFFIKNLESVQGDERDVIILSVGYGRDRDGQLWQAFGPINNGGGERRLNVAVTRARYQMLVVSSLHAADISPTTNPGPRALRRYLDYAERGTAALTDDPLAVRANANAAPNFESPFEQAVYDALTARGLTLDTQVGCSGFRIDLAVRDPQQPNVYLLGIECDGASYHSARTARDRDRLRQRCLEGLGWRIHRIWSSDWFRDPASQVARTLEVVAEAQAQHNGLLLV